MSREKARRDHVTWKLTLVAAFLACGMGLAWFLWPRPLPGERGGPFELLLYKDVQKELQLSGDQIDKIKELIVKSWKAYKEAFDDKDAVKENKVAGDTIKTLKLLLTPEQFMRLQQLQTQQLGPAAFFNPKVAKTLDLSDEQKEKIKEIFKNCSKNRRELYFKGAIKSLADVDKNLLSEIMKNLNVDQKRKFEDILGDPYKGKLPVLSPLFDERG